MGSTQDGRPLYNLSLAVNYAMHGLWRPGYRIVNLLLHLLNACLVFDIARRLQAISRPDRDGMAERRDGWLAAGVALLWAVHPLHAHVVTYAAQRAESLAASFILGACDAAIVALVHGSAGAATIAAVCAIGGGLAKETTAAILPLVGGFHWAYRDRLPATITADGRRLAVVLYAGLALNLLTLAAVRYGIGGRGDTAGFNTAPLTAHLLTQARAIWLYAGRVIWPATLVLDHGYGLVERLDEVWPQVLATLIVGVAIAVGCVLRPRLAMPLLAAAILLAPSTLVPVAMQTIAEHRAYLASACLLGMLVIGAGSWMARREAGHWFAAIICCLAVACVMRTISRNRDFATAESIWTQNVRDCPENPRGLKNLVGLLIRNGQQYDLAEAAYRDALRQPLLAEQAAAGLGDIYRQTGRLQAAVAAYQSVIDADRGPTLPLLSSLVGLGTTRLQMREPRLAVAPLTTALAPTWNPVRMPPDDRSKLLARAEVSWAGACRALGDTATADRLLSAAVSSAAKRGGAEAAARACDEVGEFAAAARLWEPLAAADPALLANLAVSRMEAGQTDAAIVAFAEAVRRFPNDQGMRDNLQRAQGIAAARARLQSSAEGR
jgi:tetratricopeptide (TPR) repeat protein